MKSLLLSSALALVTAAPVQAQIDPVLRNCRFQHGQATCVGWVVGASICYERQHPGIDTAPYAAQLLEQMGLHRAYLGTNASNDAAVDYIRNNCLETFR